MDYTQSWLILCVFALTYISFIDAGFTCLSCDSAVQPTACAKVERCTEHEVCFMDMYLNHVGAIRYRLGCMDQQQCAASSGGKRSVTLQNGQPLGNYTEDHPDDDPILCSQCCHGDLCNTAGCGKTGFQGRHSRGPICFQCSDQSRTDDCDTIHMCSIDEICMLRHKQSDIGHIVEYESRCERKDTCDRLYSMVSTYGGLLGKRFSHGTVVGGECKVQCCNDDICNTGANCNSSLTSQITSSPNPQTTSSSTSQTSSSLHMTASCISNPCQHGSCSEISGTYGCSCELGYFGRNCEKRQLSTSKVHTTPPPIANVIISLTTTSGMNACMFNPCVFGSCSPSGITYVCNCNTGYTGPNCDSIKTTTAPTHLTACLSNPCVHGTCSEFLGTYVCSCPNGYYGRNCQSGYGPVTATTTTSRPVLHHVTTIPTTKDPWPHFTPVVAGNVASNHLHATGIAASRLHPGIIYAVNGHHHEGHQEIYALNEYGYIIATFRLRGDAVTHSDWQDIAVGPCHPGLTATCIYIADTGSGHDEGPENNVYRIAEPISITNQDIQVHHSDRLNFDWHHGNFHALMVDPNANVYLISNERELARLPMDGWGGHKVNVEHLGTVAIAGHPQAADISPDGSEVLIKTEGEIAYWNIGTSRNYASLVYGQGRILTNHADHLAEAICWDNKGRDYYTISGERNASVYHYVRT